MKNQKNLYRDCLQRSTKRPYLKPLDLRGILRGIIPLKNYLSMGGFAPPTSLLPLFPLLSSFTRRVLS